MHILCVVLFSYDNDWAEIPFPQNCTFHLFLELSVCLLPMEHVVPSLRCSNSCSVHISMHIEWRYRMLSAIILRFRIPSIPVWCTVTQHPARRAPSRSVVSTLTIIVHINSNCVCYCTSHQIFELPCCFCCLPKFAKVQSAFMIPHQ